jgi:Fe-S cluster assembly protein SufD
MVRNDTHVALDGRGANADVIGLYLMDRKQFVDNHVFISHNVPNCTSNQLFKGIVDEEAKSVYNGHTLVQKDAQQTLAFQNNNNIQLTNTSKVDSHPFLEIYADDVKCSHGSTVGQLDTDAMFYLMQRGICERNAKMLLMVAFVGEIVDKIKLTKLRDSIDELVRKRLKGELSSCEQCSIQCSNPDAPIEFEIDMSLL